MICNSVYSHTLTIGREACPNLERREFSDAMTHYESTPFNAKPMELQEEPDNLVFPNVAFFLSSAEQCMHMSDRKSVV